MYISKQQSDAMNKLQEMIVDRKHFDIRKDGSSDMSHEFKEVFEQVKVEELQKFNLNHVY